LISLAQLLFLMKRSKPLSLQTHYSVSVSINGFLTCKTTAPHVTDPVLLCMRTWGRCNKAALVLQWSGVGHQDVCRSGEEERKDLEEESRTR
jgi:hypothetical protein